MTRTVFIAVTVFFLMLGPVGLAPAEDIPGPLSQRVEDVRKLIQKNPTGFETVFASSFLAKVPPDKLAPTLRDFFQKGGEVVSVLQVKSQGLLAAEYRFFTKTTVFPVKISIGETSTHLVEGLWLGMQSPRLNKAADAVTALAALPGKVSFAVWQLGGKEPVVLAAHNADEQLAIGSAFKLYILGALMKDIANGKRKWDDVTVLKKEWRSWPSGILHTWPEGAPLTLHTLASQMISISDNTATDHLLYLVGRERVEAMLEAMGNRAPSQNKPFISTGEMVLIKNTAARQERIARYSSLDEAGRRLFLDQLGKQPRPDHLEPSSTPQAIDKIEWFASAADLCRAMDWLRLNSENGPAVQARGVLSINKGLTWSEDKWQFVGYKGGSEPGVLSLTWIAQRNDGTWFALSGGWNNPSAALDETKLLEVLQAVILTLE
jgi:hypothetical protein